MTIDELLKLTGGNSSGGTSAKKPYNKYGAKRTGGHASRKEHKRAAELKLMQLAGEISGLREQVSFELIPTQRDPSGKLLERSCRYIADFVYNDRDGNLVVEDTKGFRTKDYLIKRKLMLHVHAIRIKEI
ncbi:MAG: DUF1064 domain-containing protein [Muribaculaceae bacterium]|nr:DUF1064 domain-containing protein [Muribaculaceae bacterium]